MVKRDQFEVDSLHKWPNHPILLQGSPVCSFQLLLWAGAFHDSHATEEDEEIGASEDSLVGSNAGEDLDVLVSEDNLVLEEFEPGCSRRTENSYTR